MAHIRHLVLLASTGWFLISATTQARDPLTSAILGPIEDSANNVINNAGQIGNTFAKTIGEEIRNSIETWKKANSELLNQAFSSVDTEQKNLFNDMANMLTRLENDENVAMSDAQRLSENIASMEKRLPFVNHDPEVWDYRPRVILPSKLKIIAARMTGPSISAFDPTVSAADKNLPVEVNKTTDNELVAEIPRKQIDFNEDGSNFVAYSVTIKIPRWHWYNPFSWGSVEIKERKLLFWALPKTMARYTIAPIAKNTLPPEYTTYPADFSPHGKDNSYDAGWRIPPDLVKDGWSIDFQGLLKTPWATKQSEGGSSCTGVLRESITATTFTYRMQHGHNTDGWGHQSDAVVECAAQIPLTRTLTKDEPAPLIEGDLNWADDVSKNLPDNTQSFELSLVMFDGRKYIISKASDVPYGLVDVKIDGIKNIKFRPRPPSDF